MLNDQREPFMDKVGTNKRRTWSVDTKVILATLFSLFGGMNISSGIDEFFMRKDHYHWAFNILVALAFFLSAVAFSFRSSVKSDAVNATSPTNQ
jgi:hypothetical protein